MVWKGFHGTVGIVFPMVGFVLSERCSHRFFCRRNWSMFFFQCQDSWYPKNSPKSWATRRGGIWDDMPGVIVELRDFNFDLFPDTEDEEEEAGQCLGRGKNGGQKTHPLNSRTTFWGSGAMATSTLQSRSSLMEMFEEITRWSRAACFYGWLFENPSGFQLYRFFGWRKNRNKLVAGYCFVKVPKWIQWAIWQYWTPRYMHDGFHFFSKLASGWTWCVAPSCIKDAEKESHDKQTTCQKSNFLGSLEIKIWNSYLDFACKYADPLCRSKSCFSQ